MGTVLYLDCASGASGDMLLGALLDLGVPIDDLRAALGDLLPEGTTLRADRVWRSGIGAMAFSVQEPGPSSTAANSDGHRHAHDHAHAHGHGDGHHPHDHPHQAHDHHHEEGAHGQEPQADHAHHHRPLREIERLIARSALPAHVQERARQLYRRLAEVEASIHGMPVEQIHLHEVGAVDSVVDIVGAVWAFDRLGVERVVASPLNVGAGQVKTAHGLLPVPAPATLRLLEGAPAWSDGTPFELLTPTGALLVTSYASAWGAMPAMRVIRTGYGAGGRDLPGKPNVLRAILGEEAGSSEGDRVVVIETNIDDMNPQIFGVVTDALFDAGAVDAYLTPVQMKKGRPGTLVTVIAPPARRAALTDVLLRETSTIGVRWSECDRECLSRTFVEVATPFGTIRCKEVGRDGVALKAAPEFDDCVARAREHRVAVRDVQQAAEAAYLQQRGIRREPSALERDDT